MVHVRKNNSLFVFLLPVLLVKVSTLSSQHKLNAYSETKDKPNFVFIFIDDLVPALPTYGNSDVLAPNITKLANEGIQFNRAYCNVPVCGASRASLLTGLRPHWPNRFTN
jgi:hypothetical protein